MTKLKILIVVALISFITVSCGVKKDSSNSPVLNEVVTLHNLHEIADKAKQDNQMTKEEYDYFTNAIIRLADKKDSIIGKTVGDLINAQKEFLHKQSFTAFERTCSRIELILNSRFDYKGIQPRDTNNQMIDILIFELTNSSDKDIAKIEGVLDFYSQDNQLIKRYTLKFDKPLKPNEKAAMGNPFVHDPNNQRDVIVRTAKNLKAVWTPSKITYSDGSVLKDLASEVTN